MLGIELGQGGIALLRLGHPEPAAVLWGAGAPPHSTPDFVTKMVMDTEARLIDALGPDRFAALRERGASMDPRTAVDFLRTEASRALGDV
jgi:hypothetical protein